jgi:hypothetical protein
MKFKEWFLDFDSYRVNLEKATVSVLAIVTSWDLTEILGGLFIAAQLFFLLRDKWWRERKKKEE